MPEVTNRMVSPGMCCPAHRRGDPLGGPCSWRLPEVRAVRWQTRGRADVLDARLASGAGTSKIHALRDPMRWDGKSWSLLASRPTACGRSVARDDDLMTLRAFGSDKDVTCSQCRKALA